MSNNTDLVKIKLQIKAKQANPSPPIGPILGQKGINIMSFCKEFNHRTRDLDNSTIVRAVIVIKPDKTFTLTLKKPPISQLILKALSLERGVEQPGRQANLSISMSEVKKIANIKIPEMTGADLISAINMICGTAKSMGIKVA